MLLTSSVYTPWWSLLNLCCDLNITHLLFLWIFYLLFFLYHNHHHYNHTARKTIFSFSGRPEKMVFPKNMIWNMIFLVLSGKMIFLFSENMILHVRRKMKDDLSKKIHGNMIFSSSLLKIRSFQKVPRWHMIFLVLSGKMVFFSWKHLFSLGRKRKTAFLRKYMETWCIAQRKKQETWYIGSKFGLSLNLFGWRYSTMNNLQYFVPFSPQGLCLRACLSANNKGNHLSIRG